MIANDFFNDGTLAALTWTYDASDQLTRERRVGTTFSYDTTYTYDATGNRLLKVDSGNRTTYEWHCRVVFGRGGRGPQSARGRGIVRILPVSGP